MPLVSRDNEVSFSGVGAFDELLVLRVRKTCKEWAGYNEFATIVEELQQPSDLML